MNKSWLVTRKKHLKQIKQQVEVHLGGLDPEVHSYQTAYQREFYGDWNESSFQRLYNSILQSKLVFGADFHAFSQSQRTHLRILREIANQKDIILCLECVQYKYQKYIDQYLAGKITEQKFLKQVFFVKV